MKEIEICWLDYKLKNLKDKAYRPWSKEYDNEDYEKAYLIVENIKSLAYKKVPIHSKSDEHNYFIQVNSLDEYFALFKLLTQIPCSKIIVEDNPDTIYVSDSSDSFCQVED